MASAPTTVRRSRSAAAQPVAGAARRAARLPTETLTRDDGATPEGRSAGVVERPKRDSGCLTENRTSRAHDRSTGCEDPTQWGRRRFANRPNLRPLRFTASQLRLSKGDADTLPLERDRIGREIGGNSAAQRAGRSRLADLRSLRVFAEPDVTSQTRRTERRTRRPKRENTIERVLRT